MFRSIISIILICLLLSACAASPLWGYSEQYRENGKWSDMGVGMRERKIPMGDVISSCRNQRDGYYTYYAIKLTNIDTGEEHVFICEDIRKQYPRQRK